MRRKLYKELLHWKNAGTRKPAVLRGARQVGKTYLLKQFGESEFENCHYLNFEESERVSRAFEGDLRPGRILEELSFTFGRAINTDRDLLILDEIQRCPRALTSLKYFCEEMPAFAVCAAGSLLGVYLSDESFPVGKVSFFDLYPLTYEEFLEGCGYDHLAESLRSYTLGTPLPGAAHDEHWRLWRHFLVTGGLPEAVNTYREGARSELFTAAGNVRIVQRDLIDAHTADIAKHSGKTNAMHVERVWRNVPAQLARNQNGSSSRFRFRDAIPGVRGYERLAGPIAWLESAGLLVRASLVESPSTPLSSHASENRFKLYMADCGLLGALAEIPPEVMLQYGYGTYQGYMAENFVAQELRAAGCHDLYFWQGRTSEIEFLLTSGRSAVPIEVKSGSVTRSRSLAVFEQKYAPRLSVVLSARNQRSSPPRYHVPVYAAGFVPALIRSSW